MSFKESILKENEDEAMAIYRNIFTHPTNDLEFSRIISPRVTNKRYLFLILATLLRFGRNYAYDNPQSLESALTDPKGDFALSNFKYNLLYGVYSFPNIILPFIAGLIIDRLGSRIGVLLFAFFIIIGQFFVLLGGIFLSFPLMIFGRVIFGLGGETLIVTQNTAISKWFGNKELAFAMAMDIAVARIGGTLNSVLTPYFYSVTNTLFLPLLIGLILCVFSWFCGLAMFYMDKIADETEGSKEKGKGENVNLSGVKRFNFGFWMMTINCMMIYGAFFGFTGNGNDILIKLYGMSSNKAGILLMIFYLSSALATPFFGIWADKYGKRVTSMIIVISVFILSLLMILYIPSDCDNNIVILPLVLIGLFYSIYATMFFPCIPLLVKENMIGTAFGLNNSIENINLSVSPMIFGVIHDQTQKRQGYYWSIMWLVAQALIGLFSMVAVYVHNVKTKGKLEKTVSGVPVSNSVYSSF